MPLNALADFVLLAALWGSSFLFARLAVVEFGPVPTAFMRCLIAAVVLVPLVLGRGMGADLRRHWKAAALVGVLNSAIPFAMFAFAVQHISTGLSSILNATVPMFGAVIAWLWLKDRLEGQRVLGLVLGFAGVALLASGSVSASASAGWAVLASLVACLCYGVAANATKRFLTGIHSLVLATASQIGATLVLALPAAATAPARWPGAGAWLAMAALGVLCTGLAYVLYFRVIEKAGPARAVAVTFLIPVFAMAYGVAFLGERVTAWMLACGVLIVLGTALSVGLLRWTRPAPVGR